MGLSTTMIVYFMVKLEAIVRYTFFNLFQSDNLQLQINICSCQQQTNAVDCEIYTVANAFYISSGTDVSDITFDKNRMRTYFRQCLEPLNRSARIK